jgi:hypothetical protein
MGINVLWKITMKRTATTTTAITVITMNVVMMRTPTVVTIMMRARAMTMTDKNSGFDDNSDFESDGANNDYNNPAYEDDDKRGTAHPLAEMNKN